MRMGILLSLTCLMPSTAMAQFLDPTVLEEQAPTAGEVKKVPVGGTLWEHTRYPAAKGAVIKSSVFANWGSAEVVSLPAGSGLFALRLDKMKACSQYQTYSMGTTPRVVVPGWRGCLIDSDNDGKFEKVSYNDVGFSKKVDPPVEYERRYIGITGENHPNFKKTLLFLGVASGTLRVSYREFAGDLARPAFTEELTFPLGEKFPQAFAIKDKTITVLGVDGMGLEYRIEN